MIPHSEQLYHNNRRLDNTITWIVLLGLVAAICFLTLVGFVNGGQSQVEINKPFTLAWDWSKGLGGDVNEFVVEVNGTEVMTTSGTTTATIPGPSNCGALSIRVGARNQYGTGWAGPLVANVIGCAPNPPSNIRIVLTVAQQADGSWLLKVEQVVVK